jgi:Protein of unknown function (DUF2917)
MKISLEDSHVELRDNQTLRLDDAVGVAVACVRGALWITQHGDLRDVVLAPGQCFTLDRRGVALVSALEASSVRLEQATRARGRWRRLAADIWRSGTKDLRLAIPRVAPLLAGVPDRRCVPARSAWSH